MAAFCQLKKETKWGGCYTLPLHGFWRHIQPYQIRLASREPFFPLPYYSVLNKFLLCSPLSSHFGDVPQVFYIQYQILLPLTLSPDFFFSTLSSVLGFGLFPSLLSSFHFFFAVPISRILPTPRDHYPTTVTKTIELKKT